MARSIHWLLVPGAWAVLCWGATAASAEPEAAAERRSPSFRLDLGAGYSAIIAEGGSPGKVDKDTGIKLKVSDTLGGAGSSWVVGAAVDDWIGQGWFLGFEYVGQDVQNNTKIKLSNIPVIGTAKSNAKVKVDLATFFINAGYRVPEGPWHPYFGLGVGGGVFEGHFKLKETLGAETATSKVSTSSGHLGLQGFFGVDYDITSWLYAGLVGRVYYVNGKPIDVDIEATFLSAQGRIGVRWAPWH